MNRYFYIFYGIPLLPRQKSPGSIVEKLPPKRQFQWICSFDCSFSYQFSFKNPLNLLNGVHSARRMPMIIAAPSTTAQMIAFGIFTASGTPYKKYSITVLAMIPIMTNTIARMQFLIVFPF